MDIQTMCDKLQNLQSERAAYQHASAILHFDGSTVAPRGSAQERGMVMGMLSQKGYELFVNDDVKKLLDALWEKKDEITPEQARQVELMRKELDNLTRTPMDEYVEYVQLMTIADEKWRLAKEVNDYAIFEPYLVKTIEFKRKFASYKDANIPAYDAMLDDYEKGITTETLDAFFGMLREKLVPLITLIKQQPPKAEFANASCSIPKQRELSDYLMEVLGLDRNYCAIAETEHPVTMGINKHDVRITTHYFENDLLSSMYSVIHEGGHALYELNIAEEYQRTVLYDAASIGMHESQSRFFENMIGHHPAFAKLMLSKLAELFPQVYENVDQAQLYRAINHMQPSLIRTDADEVTYPLHIMVRYELEKKLISGELSTKDLPDAWNAMYKDYLGIDVPTDSVGVLQDMHWSAGFFGYFPTYALGSAYAAQYMATIEKEIDIAACIEQSDLSPITAWLTEHVHKHGRMLDPKDIIMNATGEAFSAQHYVDYLAAKVKDVYGV